MIKHCSQILLVLTFLFFVTNVSAQPKTQYTCGDDQLRQLLQKVDSTFNYLQQKSNLQIRDHIKQMPQNKTGEYVQRTTAGNVFTIPVVVHVVHPNGQPYGTGTNITYAQIRSQLDALNAAFSKNYPGYNGQSHPAYAADAQIQFCLAIKSNDTTRWFNGPGGPEFGVRRYPVDASLYNHYITGSSASQLVKLTDPSGQSFPFDKYLNIWLVSTIEGGNNVMGYAPRPILPGYLLDGVVMRADIFGDNSTGGNYPLGFGLAQGKVLAHEVGHYLNLLHIFQGGCAGANAAGSATDGCDINGDMICDIEPGQTQNIGCDAAIPNTCTANYATGTTTLDMINDYMSYADDDCMTTFTHDQVLRMWATLELYRKNIWQPANLVATGVIGNFGCVPPFLNAQINRNEAIYCVGKSITFSNPTAGNTATSWQWRFPGGSPAMATGNNTNVSYSQPGSYKAFLTVGNGTNQRTDSVLFAIADCKPDSSLLYMANWYFGQYGAIDFSSGYPFPTKTALVNRSMQGESGYTGQLPFNSSTVSISDSMGNLLFYSNAVSVWNKNHKKITAAPMFGVSDINASTGFYYVPFPGQKSKYFVLGAYPNFDVKPSGIRYVLVDLAMDTVSQFKEFSHPILPNRFSQYVTVVPHCNGTDYWIVVKGFGLEDTKFYSLLVTENGIDVSQEPVVSSGFFQPGFGGSGSQLKANRQGNILILASPNGYIDIEAGAIYNFDNRTGKVSNERRIPNVPRYNNIQTGAAFSPNGEYFYLFRSTNLATNGKPYWLFQYRVSDMQFNILSAAGFYFAAPMQPGPDNNIYVTTQELYIDQITNPDIWGGAVLNAYFINSRALNDSIRTGVSIPNFIDARQPGPAAPDFITTTINCNTIAFETRCLDRFTATWNFGDGTPPVTGNSVQHQFAMANIFKVQLTITQGSQVYGSVTKPVTVLPLLATIAGPQSVCTNSVYLSQYSAPVLGDVIYKWIASGGAISGPDNLYYANVNWSPANITGTVQLSVSRQGCTLTANRIVNILPGPNFSWSLPDSICLFDSSIQLSASPQGGKYAGKGISGNRFSPNQAGVGFHTITYMYGDEVTCQGQIDKIIKVSRCNEPIGPNTNCDEVLKSVRVAPNPIGNTLRLQSTYALGFVQVFNASGQLVAKGNLVNNSLPLPGLAAGIYSAAVFCKDGGAYKAVTFVKGR